jgi:hypothetical protein
VSEATAEREPAAIILRAESPKDLEKGKFHEGQGIG